MEPNFHVMFSASFRLSYIGTSTSQGAESRKGKSLFIQDLFFFYAASIHPESGYAIY